MGCCVSVPQTNGEQAKVGQNGYATTQPATRSGYDDCKTCDFWSAALDPKNDAFLTKADSIDRRLESSVDKILKLKAEEAHSKESRANGKTHFREDTANIQCDYLKEPRNSTGHKDKNDCVVIRAVEEAQQVSEAPYDVTEDEVDVLLEYDPYGTPLRPKPEEEEDDHLDDICKSCESIVMMKQQEKEEKRKSEEAEVKRRSQEAEEKAPVSSSQTDTTATAGAPREAKGSPAAGAAGAAVEAEVMQTPLLAPLPAKPSPPSGRRPPSKRNSPSISPPTSLRPSKLNSSERGTLTGPGQGAGQGASPPSTGR